jgi:hypothetical protein
MDHLKKFDDILNIKNSDEISIESPIDEVTKKNIHKALPYDARNIEINDELNYISWVMDSNDDDDDNKSFTIYYSFSDGSLGWEGNDIASGAEYYKPVKTIEEFEQAMDDWHSDIDKWFY